DGRPAREREGDPERVRRQTALRRQGDRHLQRDRGEAVMTEVETDPRVLDLPTFEEAALTAAVLEHAEPSSLVDAKERHRGRKRRRRSAPSVVRKLTGPLIVLGVWQLLCTTGVVNENTLASP